MCLTDVWFKKSKGTHTGNTSSSTIVGEDSLDTERVDRLEVEALPNVHQLNNSRQEKVITLDKIQWAWAVYPRARKPIFELLLLGGQRAWALA